MNCKFVSVRLGTSLIGACAIAMFAGCAPGPHLFVTTTIVNGGSYELGDEMRNRHLIAFVGYDEALPMNYPAAGKSSTYVHGLRKGTPEYGYRAAILTMGQLKGALWYADGQYMWITTALIPDHISRVKAYDIVEFRQLNAWKTLDNFSQTGEGNVIVKVHCRRADADYEACKNALPQIGKFGPSGL